jgi:hypothetical protein
LGKAYGLVTALICNGLNLVLTEMAWPAGQSVVPVEIEQARTAMDQLQLVTRTLES